MTPFDVDGPGEDGGFRCIATIRNKLGLHARAAARFVKLAVGFDADVEVTKGSNTVSGGSVMGLLMLGASPGTEITITTRGREAKEAIKVLCGIVEDKFEEE